MSFDDTVFFSWDVEFFGLVVKGEVVLFTCVWLLGFHVLFWDVDPVTHSALCDALEQQKLLLGRPILCKQTELQIVEYYVLSDRLWLLVGVRIADGHACSVALKTDYQWLVGSLSLNWTNFDALRDVSIAETTKLRTDDIFEISKFSIIKLAYVLCNLLLPLLLETWFALNLLLQFVGQLTWLPFLSIWWVRHFRICFWLI